MSGLFSESAAHAGASLRPFLTTAMREWIRERDGSELWAIVMLGFMERFSLSAGDAGRLLGRYAWEQARAPAVPTPPRPLSEPAED